MFSKIEIFNYLDELDYNNELYQKASSVNLQSKFNIDEDLANKLLNEWVLIHKAHCKGCQE